MVCTASITAKKKLFLKKESSNNSPDQSARHQVIDLDLGILLSRLHQLRLMGVRFIEIRDPTLYLKVLISMKISQYVASIRQPQ